MLVHRPSHGATDPGVPRHVEQFEILARAEAHGLVEAGLEGRDRSTVELAPRARKYSTSLSKLRAKFVYDVLTNWE